MKQVKQKECSNKECRALFYPRTTLDKYCSPGCFYKETPKQKKVFKPINKFSKKNAPIQRRYTPLRIAFLSKTENKYCVIKSEKCTHLANTIEHSRGRGDYYVDEWAEKNDKPLTLDERFWKPACLNCNLELENNPELSKAHQLSKLHGGKKL